jgi:drug/metabolite transporter (DMT)-like permease
MWNIFAVTVGFFVFSEVPETWVWSGAIIIVAAATYLARIEIKTNTTHEP